MRTLTNKPYSTIGAYKWISWPRGSPWDIPFCDLGGIGLACAGTCTPIIETVTAATDKKRNTGYLGYLKSD